MKWIGLLLSLFLLPSCSSVLGGGQDIRIPVAETEQIATWAGQAGGFDANGDGFLEDAEASAFLTWFSFQVLNTWVFVQPEGPRGPTTPEPIQ